MSQLIGWIIAFGLTIVIVCIFMLSRQLEKYTRTMAEMMLRSNEMLLAQLEQLTNPSPQAPEPVVGVVLERRRAQCWDPLTQMSGKPRVVEASDLPRRRVEDLPLA